MKVNLPSKQLKIYLSILISMIIPFAWTLSTIKHPVTSPDFQMNPSPYGYTISLTLFMFPILVFSLWLLSKKNYKIESKAFGGTILLIFLLGSFLDFVFGYSFFYFPNQGSVVGTRLPSFSFREWKWIQNYLPIEEFGFYFFGASYMLCSYLWGVLYWFRRYNHDDHMAIVQNIPRLISVNYRIIFLCIGLVVAGVFVKKLGPYPEGFSGYFTFLVLMAFLPSMVLYNVTKYLVNWRSFTFMSFLLLLISIVYEATLGVPYGWWRYNTDQMLGILITGWSYLPIEAVLLWIAAGFGTVFLFEGLRAFFYMNRTFRYALFGSKESGAVIGSTKIDKLPLYIDQGNFMPVPRGPYVNTIANMSQFLVEVDPQKIRTIADCYLNQNLKSGVQYFPFLKVILMTYAKLVGYVSDDYGKNIGQLPEDDLVFWIPLLAVKNFLGVPIPSHIAMFPFRLYVNSPYGLASGREVYGFRKTFAEFEGPVDFKNPEFSLKVLGFDRYDPKSQGQMFELIKLEKSNVVKKSSLQKFESHADYQKGFYSCLLSDNNQNLIPDLLDDFVKFIVNWVEPQTTSVALKQFRDIVDPSKSCLQQVVEAKTQITDFYGGGILESSYDLTVKDIVSEPLSELLGIKLINGKQSLSVGFWLQTSFIMKNGMIIQ